MHHLYVYSSNLYSSSVDCITVKLHEFMKVDTAYYCVKCVCHFFVDKLTWNIRICGLHNICKCKYYATFICPQVKLTLVHYSLYFLTQVHTQVKLSYVKCMSFTCNSPCHTRFTCWHKSTCSYPMGK